MPNACPACQMRSLPSISRLPTPATPTHHPPTCPAYNALPCLQNEIPLLTQAACLLRLITYPPARLPICPARLPTLHALPK
ncbi:hypothetical protein CC85DRAFT_73554 [Cutaneotrichosporon oleaginosum]|uniref:Uncharacterized protein n=1 Tax=Cutaneotrichosporon oleaginosum TaxID=879819 RepID=A0A0J0XNW0_9TREE|nr:uncharacterized protein CC85DRAFT_73554 [Cutaneotrichosporon oleaginosum]KLT42778.1 hypothetical protein CC85DRAFT_73554 [Cutaneotrichosporon oleaginosum]TXT08254.1 hypothetical protein COLE_05178 [Cutaneotrichosporon oleaginosum]